MTIRDTVSTAIDDILANDQPGGFSVDTTKPRNRGLADLVYVLLERGEIGTNLTPSEKASLVAEIRAATEADRPVTEPVGGLAGLGTESGLTGTGDYTPTAGLLPTGDVQGALDKYLSEEDLEVVTNEYAFQSGSIATQLEEIATQYPERVVYEDGAIFVQFQEGGRFVEAAFDVVDGTVVFDAADPKKKREGRTIAGRNVQGDLVFELPGFDQDDKDFIGVDEGYVAKVPSGVEFDTFPDSPFVHPGLIALRNAGRGVNVPYQAGPSYQPEYNTVQPRYEVYANWKHFVGKSPEYIATVQRHLVDAGIVDDDDVTTPGFWGNIEIVAMEQLMMHANRQGKTWLQIANELAEIKRNNPDLGGREDNRYPFVAPSYRAPDYATLAQAVKATVRNQLGRDPKDAEMALLSDSMSADYRTAYEADVEAARNEYNATGRAIKSDSSQRATAVGDVDPAARFLEHFEARYAPEIEHVDDVRETFQNQSLLFRSLAGLDSMVRR